MRDFLIQRISEIDWSYYQGQLLSIVLLLFWLRLIWPTDEFKALIKDKQKQTKILIPLLGFPEALLNGMAVTLLVVYRPQWLYDYSDKTYFND